jgi:hypothetical protein
LRTLLLITIVLFVGICSVVGSTPQQVAIKGLGLSSTTGGLTTSTSAAGSSPSGSSAVGASAAGYTPQQVAINGLGLSFKMGQMYALAQQGYNVSGFNAEVDKYNAWVQQNLGNDPNLMMSKMSTVQESGNVMPRYFPVPRTNSVKPIHTIDASFNQTTPRFPPGAVQNGRIFDMPAGAWWTTYGPYLPDYYGGNYYGRNHHGRNFYRDYYGALPG